MPNTVKISGFLRHVKSYLALSALLATAVIGVLPAHAATGEQPVVILSYAKKADLNLCVELGCDDRFEMLMQPLRGFWYETPQEVIPTSIEKARRMTVATVRDAILYDYSAQVYGTKQDVVNGFVTADHQALWQLIGKFDSGDVSGARNHEQIKIHGYARHPDHPAVMMVFVSYRDQAGETRRRLYALTVEEGRLKRSLRFPVDHKNIYRVVEHAYKQQQNFWVRVHDRAGNTVREVNPW